MSVELQVISTVVSEMVIQIDAVLSKEPDKVAQVIEWLTSVPGVGWGLAGLAIAVAVAATTAKLTVNLDKIVSFQAKYLRKANAELSEQQLNNIRQQLLKQMTTDVALRLEDSLHNLIRVDLEREEQRYQVGRQKDILVKTEPKRSQPFSNLISRELAIFDNQENIEPVAIAERTHSIFYRSDIGGRLLILGEPGAGKTTELLTVAQRLVEVAIDNADEPIPILFELASWASGTPTLTWLGQQLTQNYGVSKRLAEPLARRWIQKTQLLLLLDGSDELGHTDQVVCIEMLEKFLSQHPTLPAIICCRREEYGQGRRQLKQLKGAIYLQPIDAEQIRQYLKALGRDQLWGQVQTQAELLGLAQSPLCLTMLAAAYQGQSIRDKAVLFDVYIQKQLHNLSHKGVYQPSRGIVPKQTLHYLTWLARQLSEKEETEFLIEHLQPDWLVSPQQKRIYKLVVALVFVLFFCLFFGLALRSIEGLIGGLALGLFLWLLLWPTVLGDIRPTEQLKWSPTKGLIEGLRVGLRVGLVFGLTSGLISVLLGGLNSVLFGGLPGGLWVVLEIGLVSGLFSGLISGLWLGLGTALFEGLSSEAIQQKQAPNQGIKKSIQNAMSCGLISGLSFGLIAALISGLTAALIATSIGGLVGGLYGGLIPSIQHFVLRIVLTGSGCIPWNYAQFLEHAVNHRLIQRTGGRYRFIHGLFREHFAQMTPQQQAELARFPRE